MENMLDISKNNNTIQRIFITRTDEAKFCSNWIAFFQKGKMELKDFNPEDLELHDYFKNIFDEGLKEEKPIFVTHTLNNSLLSFHFFPIDHILNNTDTIINQVSNTNFLGTSPSIGIYINHNLLNTTETVHFLSSLVFKLEGVIENFYLLTNDLGLNSTLNIAKMVKNNSKTQDIKLFH